MKSVQTETSRTCVTWFSAVRANTTGCVRVGILCVPQRPPSLTMADAITPPSTFTDDKDLDLAFPTEFIPAEVRAALPEDLHVC